MDGFINTDKHVSLCEHDSAEIMMNDSSVEKYMNVQFAKMASFDESKVDSFFLHKIVY